MRTFELVGGDLVLGEGGFALVTGQAKVKQDLGVAMREPYGCDRFHPRWGSILINYVGEPIEQQTSFLIQSEVGRIIRNYIMVQGGVVEEDVTAQRRSRLTMSEVVVGVNGIDVRQNQDKYHVRVRLSLFSGEEAVLTGTVT